VFYNRVHEIQQRLHFAVEPTDELTALGVLLSVNTSERAAVVGFFVPSWSRLH